MPRNIDDIVPPSQRRHASEDGAPSRTSFPPSRQKRSFPYGTALVAIIVIALAATALYALGGAKVQITPTTNNVTLSGASFTGATDGTGDVPFKVVSVTDTQSVTVPAESTQTANDSAQGSIAVSNTLTTPEKFVTNTRFQSASGLIYRIHAPITIPAATSNGPGTLTVTIYADQPGQQYNIDPTTFTVPGLQGTDAYAAITAKSNGPIAGGFTGTRASVSSNTDTTQQQSLQTKLQSVLKADLAAKVPAGYVALNGGTFTAFTSVPDSATTTSSVVISEQGTATAVVFPADGLAKAIGYKSVGTYSGQPVTLADTSTISLTPTSTTTPTESDTAFSFSLSGTANVVWAIDASKIAGAVAGKTRESAQSILQSFPEIDQATLSLRPFWMTTFPTDPAHIQVVVENMASST